MLTSITPLGERGRRRAWGPTVTALGVGSVVGGMGAGASAGLLGSALALVWRPGPGATAVLLAGLAALAGMFDSRSLGWKLPTVRRQVDEEWLTRYRGWVVGLGYGVQLGAAVTTIVTSASVYLLLAVALLTAAPVAGAVVGATFGLARALPVYGARRVTSPQRLATASRRLDAWAPHAARTTAVVLWVVAAATLLPAVAG